MTTDYAYDGTMLVREGHAAGGSLTPTATYFQGASGPCYRRDDTQTQTDGQGHTFGKTGWYVYDGLGSVVGEVDPLGNVTSSPKYDVYGAVRGNGGTANTKQGFVGSLGHLSEPETGLIYMAARYMDPQTGRFVSQDPSKNGNNWFAYCDNNPVNEVDRTGKAGGPAWTPPPALGWGGLLWVLTQALAQTGWLGQPWSRLLQDVDWALAGGRVAASEITLALEAATIGSCLLDTAESLIGSLV